MNNLKNRWVQLFLSVGVFIVISGPQYMWSLFVKPLLAKHDVALSEIQIVFSLVVVCMTFITPLAGYLHDRFNSRMLIALGLLMSSGSWIIAASADHVIGLAVFYGVFGGLGAGIAFIGCTGMIQKAFADKRGLATGILMSGYALGPMLTTPFISKTLNESGIDYTLKFYGIIFVAISCVLVFLLKDIKDLNGLKISNVIQNGVSPSAMIKTKTFWLMYVMMTAIASCGMMMISNIAIIAKEAGIGEEIMWMGMAALPLALMLDRFTNGLSRIIFGALSDKFGRENTLAFAFALEGIFVALWAMNINNPLWFILLSGLVFLSWGEIFSIFPAICTDTFGEKFASINFGFLYTSVGFGSIIGGPIAALMREHTGNWNIVFIFVVAMDILTALAAYALLKKVRKETKIGTYETTDLQVA